MVQIYMNEQYNDPPQYIDKLADKEIDIGVYMVS